MLYYATIHCTVPEGLDDGVDGQAAEKNTKYI